MSVESEVLVQFRNEGVAMLKLMKLAERDVKQGRTMSVSEAKARMK
jgi:hypothetical protein